MPVILTGTALDPPLERWWSLGRERLDAIRVLRDLGITLVTTPNFSLFTNHPRWDDLHSMKRIAIVHEGFLRLGAAVGRDLHLVLRGGTEVLPEIVKGFPSITFLETATFRGGKPAGGTVPYGFRRSRKKFVPHNGESQIVCTIFDLSRAGESCTRIAHDLNVAGYLRRNGKPWTRWQVIAISRRHDLYERGILKYRNVTTTNPRLILIKKRGAK